MICHAGPRHIQGFGADVFRELQEFVVAEAVGRAVSDYMKSKDRCEETATWPWSCSSRWSRGGLGAGVFASSKVREALWLSALADLAHIRGSRRNAVARQPRSSWPALEHAILAMEKACRGRSAHGRGRCGTARHVGMLPLLRSSDTFAARDEARRIAFNTHESRPQLSAQTADMSRSFRAKRNCGSTKLAPPDRPSKAAPRDGLRLSEIAISRGAKTAAAILSDSGRVRVLNLEYPRVYRSTPGRRRRGTRAQPDGRTLAAYHHEGEGVRRYRTSADCQHRESSENCHHSRFGHANQAACRSAPPATSPWPAPRPHRKRADSRARGDVVSPGAAKGQPLAESSFAQRTVIAQVERVEAVAPGTDSSYFATDRGIWRKSAGDIEYQPVARLPAVRHFLVVNNAIGRLAFADDGRTLTLLRIIETTQAQAEFDEMALEVWDISRYEAVSRILQQEETVGVSLNDSGDRVGVSNTNSAGFFRTRDGLPVEGVGDKPSTSRNALREFQANGGMTIQVDGNSVQVWDLWKKRATTWSFGPELREVNSVTLGSGGEFAALSGYSAEDRPLIVVRRWRGDSYSAWKTIRLRDDRVGEFEPPFSMSLSADGRRLAALYADGDVVTIRDVEFDRDVTPRSLAQVGRISEMSLSPGGRFLVMAHDDGPVTILDLSGWTASSPAQLLDKTRVCSLGFSVDDRYLGVGSCEGLVHVFETSRTDGVGEIARLPDRGAVTALAFSRDGRYVAAASRARQASLLSPDERWSLSVWTVEPTDLIAEAKKRLAAIKRYRTAPEQAKRF